MRLYEKGYNSKKRLAIFIINFCLYLNNKTPQKGREACKGLFLDEV